MIESFVKHFIQEVSKEELGFSIANEYFAIHVKESLSYRQYNDFVWSQMHTFYPDYTMMAKQLMDGDFLLDLESIIEFTKLMKGKIDAQGITAKNASDGQSI